MTEKKIYHSTLLVTYNHESYIREAIESILMQKTEYGFEIIIIDDCSTDKTSDIAKEYQAKYPDIIRYYCAPENVGNGRINTFNLRPIIRGQYWSILEGDDFWIDSQKLQKQLSFMENNPDFIGCTSAYTVYDITNHTKKRHKATLKEWTIHEMVCGRYALYSHTATWVWRHVFKDINKDGFHLHPELAKEYTFGDTCLSYFMAMQGGKIKCFDEEMTCYRVTGEGRWTKLSYTEQFKINKDIYKTLDRITNYKFTDQMNKKQTLHPLILGFLLKIKDKSPRTYDLIQKILKSKLAAPIKKILRKAMF